MSVKLHVPPSARRGINLVGPFEAGSGLGEATRMLARATERAGVPFAAINYPDSPGARSEVSAPAFSDSAPHDVNVLCLQPDQLAAFGARGGSRLLASRINVGYWFWESSALAPRHRPALRLLDAVWVPTDYVRSAVAAATTAPVRVMPLPVDERRGAPLSHEALGLPRDGFLFLALLDLISARRKNPRAVIEAFRAAFPPDSPARLVVKTMNGHDRKARMLAELRKAAADRDDITVVDGFVSERQRDAMLAACDCFVSLHRGEGLGLPLLEAMSLGKPVIATGYSGNMDYMDDEVGFIVPFRLVPVPDAEPTYSPGAVWAEPSVEAASTMFRRVFDAPGEARAVGERGRRKVRAMYSLERAADVLFAEFEAVRRRPGAVERIRREAIISASVSLACDPVQAGYPGRGPVAVVRRLLMRALWPQLSEQLRRDDAILQGLTDIERSLARLEAPAASSVDDLSALSVRRVR